MGMSCKICKKSGQKGLFQLRPEWLHLTDLEAPPPGEKIGRHHRVCFQHFQKEDFFFTGNILRIKTGKIPFKKDLFKVFFMSHVL